MDTYALPCVKEDGRWEADKRHRELRLVLCDDLEGRDVGLGGRSKREGTDEDM